jgi:hypothetical protein
MAKRKNATLYVAQIGANNRALKTANKVYRRNGNKGNHLPPLNFAHLAALEVQHEEVKREKYDASLSFSSALDNVVGARHACDAHEDFSGIADTLNNTIVRVLRANMLIHNKYYCDHRGCK